MRDALVGASQSVLSQMPLRENLRQTISRERRNKLPPNPRLLEDKEIVERCVVEKTVGFLQPGILNGTLKLIALLNVQFNRLHKLLNPK